MAFQEVSGLGMEVHVAEYRSGNATELAPIKVTGLYKAADVTFKRGVIGDISTLYARFDAVRKGGGNSPTGGETVTVNLMDDSNTTVVQSWILGNARVIKLNGPTFNGKATEVAIEEVSFLVETITQG
jgi:phage tail-like protein